MKVFISADIEGVTGVVTWAQCGGPREGHYDWEFARRMMTHDVNAAIRGARKAGADQVVVKDSHNVGRNLLIDQLEPDVELISGTGSGRDGMVEGIDASFDGLFLVGYHAMAGTAAGIMEHTYTGGVHRLSINGMPAGEIAMSTATAGVYGVPLLLVTSDQAGCDEAMHLVPKNRVAVTKTGIGRYMGRLLHPSVTGPAIEKAAFDAICDLGDDHPWVPKLPVTIRLEQNRSEEIDAATRLHGWARIDAFTIEYTGKTWPESHAALLAAMTTAMNEGKSGA